MSVQNLQFWQPLVIEHQGRTAVIRGVEAGRVYSFSVSYGLNPAVGLTCPNTLEKIDIQENRIHFDPGIKNSLGIASISCFDSQGPLALEIEYLPSRLAVVSASVNSSNQGLIRSSDPSLSKDGTKALYSSILSSVHSQIVFTDLNTGESRLASTTMSGERANRDCEAPHLSADGKTAVFASRATNLITGTSGLQIYWKNLITEELKLVSSLDGTAATQSNSLNNQPFVSDDGRYVVFESQATNLISGYGGIRIYLKDIQTGSVSMVSTLNGSDGSNNSHRSFLPSITPDGRYVVFQSDSPGWIVGAVGEDVYRKDLVTGDVLIISSADGTGNTDGTQPSENASISDDGRWVTFETQSFNTEFFPGLTANKTRVFLKDVQTGALSIISSINGQPSMEANGHAHQANISADGNAVTFVSQATNLVASPTPPSNTLRAYLKNLSTGSITLVSSTSGVIATGDPVANFPKISGNGSNVIFESFEPDLTSQTGVKQIYSKNTLTQQLTLVSTGRSIASFAGNEGSSNSSMTRDGRYIAFQSLAKNFLGGNDFYQIYRKDIDTGRIDLVSTLDGSIQTMGTSDSANPSISNDGRYIVFQSSSTNWIPGLPATVHVWRKNMQTGILELVSSLDGTAATAGNGESLSPEIAKADPRFVVFSSASTNFISGVVNQQIYLKDMQNGSLSLVSARQNGTTQIAGGAASNHPSISIDGRYVVFDSQATNFLTGATAGQIYLKDMVSLSLTLVSSLNGTTATQGNYSSDIPRISDSGDFVVFQSYARNLIAGLSQTTITQRAYRKNIATGVIDCANLEPGAPQSSCGTAYVPEISGDGNSISFFASPPNTNLGQFFTKNMQTGALTIASSRDGTTQTQANTMCSKYRGGLSTNGTIGAFSCGASNLIVSGKSGNITQIYQFNDNP